MSHAVSKRSPSDGPEAREYKRICNQPSALTLGLVQTCMTQPNIQVYTECAPTDSDAALTDSSGTEFVVQHPSIVYEDNCMIFGSELAQRKALDHLHNLHYKASDSLLTDLCAAVAEAVPFPVDKALKKCSSFRDLSKIFVDFEGSAISERLDKAAQLFCDKYKMAFGFWVQYRFLEHLNNDCNNTAHCNLADSAAALATCKLEEFQAGGAMVDALVKYAAEHHEQLEAEAEAKRLLELEAIEEFKKLRAQ